ncbi:MAG: Ig-like domain-containing protein [Candidatus Saccharibacteria bacterium]|nr:Ig-like domain-containing protein [Candidatus Saccharibacteria bacterium]
MARTYLQIGTKVDGMPPLPADIASATGLEDEERRSEVGSGAGFCFGVDLQLGAKDFKFLIFSGSLNIHLGFDVSLIRYPSSTVCQGSTSPIGIKGWYASGQIYAGIGADLSIKVKIFGKKKTFNLVHIQVAAALRAKLPNPFWAQGAIGFDYSILDGLIKGHGNFEFEIGQQCVIMGQDDPFAEVPIISSTVPLNNARNVPVITNPIVRFNFPVGVPFEFEPLNGGNISYHIILDEVKLLWRDLYEIPLQQSWANDRRSVNLSTSSFLPGKDTFTLTIKVHVDSSGVTVHEEERIVTFVTGPGITTIPASNVAGSYPLNGQFNFYKNEITNGKGYIKLKRGQPELFFEDNDFDTYVRFRGSGTGCIAIPLQVDAEDYWEKKIEFDLPLGFLANEGVYEMQVVDFPRPDPNYGQGSAGNAPCECEGCTLPPPSPPGTNLLQTTYTYDDGGESPPPSGTPPPTPPSEKILYAAYFRVSQYNTFMEKMDALEQSMERPGHGHGNGGGTPEDQPTYSVKLDFSVPTNIEPFDAFEMGGNEPMMRVKFDPGGANWSGTWYLGFVDRIKYPYEGKLPGYYNPPRPFPENTVAMTSYPPISLKIIKDHLTNGLPSSFANVEQRIRHFTPKVMYDYYVNVVSKNSMEHLSLYQNQILTTYNDICGGVTTNPCDCLSIIYQSNAFKAPYDRYICDALCSLNNNFDSPPYTYPVRVTYQLPGIGQQTYNKIIKLKPPN